MRTIEQPQTPQESGPAYRIRCRKVGCSALVEVRRSELQFWHDWLGANYYSFTCPHCQSKLSIAQGVLTKFQVPDEAEKSSLVAERK